MKKGRIIWISIIVILILIVGVLAGYIICDKLNENSEVNNIANMDEKKTNNNQSDEKIKTKVNDKVFNELQDYLKQSVVSEYLLEQGKDVDDVKKFLDEYDNQEKLRTVVCSLDYSGDEEGTEIELTKNNVLKEAKKIFGYNVDLKFEDVFCAEFDHLDYIYNEEDEMFKYNEETSGHGMAYTNKYYKVLNIEKKDGIFNVYLNVAYGDGSETDSDFFSNMEDSSAWNRGDDLAYKNIVKTLNRETLYDKQSLLGNREYEEWLVEQIFTDDVKDKWNTYKFEIKETDGTYKIVGFEIVNK